MGTRSQRPIDSRFTWQSATLALAVALLLALGLQGCGIAAAPQPPSLHLPKPVRNLQAERTGNRVQLHWTMPRLTTDGQKISAPIHVRICLQTTSRVCNTVGHLLGAPGKTIAFAHVLPTPLTQGPLRVIRYQVFALNLQGRAADVSNTALTLAGTPPPPVLGLTARTAPQGVILHWQPPLDSRQNTGQAARDSDIVSFQIQRTWMQAPSPHPASNVIQTLTVRPATGPSLSANGIDSTLDPSITWNATYRYTVARILDHPLASGAASNPAPASLQISGEPSAAIVIFAKDTFPPAPPQLLGAVVVAATPAAPAPAVDLSWSANLESDFAQYFVNRRDLTSGAPAARIAPLSPSTAKSMLVTPAFYDRSVLPGHRYAYSVQAVDTSGNASAPTPEIMVEIPAQ